MKLRGWILALLALCLLASPSDAKRLMRQVHGTLAASGTFTSDEVIVSGIEAPITIIVGYVSVSAVAALVSVESTIDGVNWDVPGTVAGTAGTLLSESITGDGTYILFPIVLVGEPGGTDTTAGGFGHVGDKIRIKVQNQSSTTALTSLSVSVYSN